MRCLGGWSRGVAALMGCALLLPSAASAFTPNDPLFGRQWYLRQIQADRAWDVSTGASSVVVAVLDAGVDATHPDIRGNMWVNADEIAGNGVDDDNNGYVDDANGWNFVTDSPNTQPMVVRDQFDEALAHGTIVSSIIAGKGDDGYGVAGVSWSAKIMPVVVLSGDGVGTVEDIADAIRYAMVNGAHIINLSLVGFETDDELDRALYDAWNAGVLVVVAAGNDDVSPIGQDLERHPMYPACSLAGHPAVLAVSATDALDQKAPYANFGVTCVGISAPGFEFVAAHPLVNGDSASTTAFVGGITGTSAAAPLVSGTAALIKSLRPDWSARQIRSRLLATADPIEEIQRAEVRGGLGRGRLNAARAVQGIVRPRKDVAPEVSRLIRSLLSAFLPSL